MKNPYTVGPPVATTILQGLIIIMYSFFFNLHMRGQKIYRYRAPYNSSELKKTYGEYNFVCSYVLELPYVRYRDIFSMAPSVVAAGLRNKQLNVRGRKETQHDWVDGNAEWTAHRSARFAAEQVRCMEEQRLRVGMSLRLRNWRWNILLAGGIFKDSSVQYHLQKCTEYCYFL